ncbi:MAG TPA: DUF5615 family PIN-like protein [Thermoanaerobaculia bacterium]|nr:DUF5615 family PIN-like protein [Thermoanaerobaculia bacterium]
MILWLDAHLPPVLARWLQTHLGVEAHPVRDYGLREASDSEIFREARLSGAVLLTKDRDFARLVDRYGPPPQIVWITAGNTSTAALEQLLQSAWPRLHLLLESGEPLIEVGKLEGPEWRS